MSRGQKRYAAEQKKITCIQSEAQEEPLNTNLLTAAGCKDAQGQTEEETTSTAAFRLQETPA